MPATPYFEGLILRYIVNQETFVVSDWWLALYSDSTATAEITSASYMRQLVTFDPATFVNTNAIAFPAYAGGDTSIRALGLCDASTSGNLLVIGPVNPDIDLIGGQVINVAVGEIVLDVLNT